MAHTPKLSNDHIAANQDNTTYCNESVLLFFQLLVLALFVGCTNNSENYISTGEALQKYEKSLHDKPFFLFSESREKPARWFDSIPEEKLNRPDRTVSLSAQPGEFFVFQLGVWALESDIKELTVEFSALTSEKKGRTIPAERMTCFNTEGVDHFGKPFTGTVHVPAGRVQPLWIGMDLDGIGKGTYTGKIDVLAGESKQTAPVSVRISGEKVINRGYNEGNRLSRLNWLNSTTGINDDITLGFNPVEMNGYRCLSVLGRNLILSENGLPAAIHSYFTPSNRQLDTIARPVINKPFRFIIQKSNGEQVSLAPGKLVIEQQNNSLVKWSVMNTSEEFDLKCTGRLEYDGFVDYQLELLSRSAISIRDIRMEVSMDKDRAGYMMGLGHEGGFRTSQWHWKWDTTRHQDKLWIGSVNGGLRLKWKAENYVRPLINVYYGFRPLNLPASWGNEGKGGVSVTEKGKNVRITAYSGSRIMQPGDRLHYDFELLITPFKLISKDKKYGDRYYHGGGTNTEHKIEKAKNAGANIINIHHAEDVYPFINYPYLDESMADLTGYIEKGHEEGMRMKVYYTTRELTKNAPEFFAFFSLGGEVIYAGPGNETRTKINKEGPHEWLIRNLREKYIPAWPSRIRDGRFRGETDLSVITTPDSRLNNFYVEGLDWMMKHMGIDGIYIDDSALDRFTLRRARKVIEEYKPVEGRIDFHSVNHFRQPYGFTCCLNLYMDLLPYFDLVWIGEGRDYDRKPDHWLIEVSGIPFGLAGQMLHEGGNPWRGMVYGITNRPGWFKPAPTGIWNFWDEHSIMDKELTGYWEKDIPLTWDNNMVRASLFYGKDESWIAIANWSEDDQRVFVQPDYDRLGYDEDKCDIFIPQIPEFQESQSEINLENIILPGGKGYIIVISNGR